MRLDGHSSLCRLRCSGMAPFGTKLTCVYVLSASTDRAQATALVSKGGVDGTGSSASGGDAENPHSQLVELILTARGAPYVTFFTCSVDRKGAWESTQRSHHTD